MRNTAMSRRPSRPNPSPPLPAKTADDVTVQALFDEIDSEVKAKQFSEFMNRYGIYVAVAVLALILGTAGYSTWSNMRGQDNQRDTSNLITLMDKDPASLSDEEAKAGMQAYDKMAKEGTSTGHKMIARFAEAGTLLEKGDTDAALASLRALRSDGSIKPLYRDYALLMEIRARMDKDAPEKVLEDMKPLLESGNAWRISALEIAAMLEAKRGDKAKALEHLKAMTETPDVPLAAVERAKLLTRLYQQ
jgi:hypothetical protein